MKYATLIAFCLCALIAQASDTSCDETGRVITLPTGGSYDAAILNEFHDDYHCSDTNGGFSLSVDGCRLKKVVVAIDEYRPPVSVREETKVSGRAWTSLIKSGGTISTVIGGKAATIEKTAGRSGLSLTLKTKGGVRVLVCEETEGDMF